jgi:hypothetical protein
VIGDGFVGDHQVRHDEDVADVDGVILDEFGERKNFANDQSGAAEGFADGSLAALDALGELDFAFPGEQRDGAHLAEIHADGIVGFVAEILNEVGVDELLAFLELFLEIDFRFFENFDAGAVELGEKVVELTAAGILLGEKLVDFVVEDVALLLAGVHELFQPAEFFVNCHAAPSVDRLWLESPSSVSRSDYVQCTTTVPCPLLPKRAE